MDKTDIKIKLGNLTGEGVRPFWNEIKEWLQSITDKCTRDFDKVKTLDELKEKQILKRLCLRMMELPENMVLTLQAQLADTLSGDITDEVRLNFFAEPSTGVKQEE